MEHGRFEYSGIGKRAPMKLPDGARVAVWITPNVEHFHWDKPAISVTAMTTRFQPDVLNYGWRDYGARVGIWRLFELFERQGIPVTAALNSQCCEFYPQIIEEGRRLDWEWMAHGRSNSQIINAESEAEERALIKDVLDTIERSTGQRSRGWLGPALTESPRTLDLLHEAGVEYVADWCNDDHPYRMKTRSGSIVALPYALEIGDIPVFMDQGGNAEDFHNLIVQQFDALYDEGATNARVLSIAVHPFLVGHAFRARYFEKALTYMRARGGVWFTTGNGLLDWYKSGKSGLDI